MSPTPSPFRSLLHYRELPQIFGWPAMLIAALARAPYAMMPLGIMTAFTAATGDIAVGGLATGIFSVATAICSPLVGRASDIWGQRKILLALTPINALGMLSLYWAAVNVIDGPLLWLLCLITGATVVPVGSFTRARWVSVTSNQRIISAAFSYESMADELLFVLGPALVGIAASAAVPSAPLLLAFMIAIIAGIPFALTAPRQILGVAGTEGEQPKPAISRVIVAVIPAIIALIAVGTYFGSVQAGTTARAEDLGLPGSAGLIYAVMGIGSAVAALLVVALPASFRMSQRFIFFSLGMGGAMIAVALHANLTTTIILLLVGGIFVGPTLVSAFTTAEKLAPPGGISVAMTLMQSAVTIGVSIGAAVGGGLAQNQGATSAYLLAVAASGAITLVGFALLAPVFRKRHSLI